MCDAVAVERPPSVVNTFNSSARVLAGRNHLHSVRMSEICAVRSLSGPLPAQDGLEKTAPEKKAQQRNQYCFHIQFDVKTKIANERCPTTKVGDPEAAAAGVRIVSERNGWLWFSPGRGQAAFPSRYTSGL